MILLMSNIEYIDILDFMSLEDVPLFSYDLDRIV